MCYLDNNMEIHNWPMTFGTTCWLLWKHRNQMLFDEDYIVPRDLVNSINSKVTSFITASSQLDSSISKLGVEKLISWWPLNHPWIKLNTDGCFQIAMGSAAAGGLIRSFTGEWQGGFIANLGKCSVLVAES